jgi:HAD superfamily hydrolase (TIGR01484 family)
MKPLYALADCSQIRAIAFDLDDTLLTHGALTLEAYEALFMLQRAGFALISATGRPANWGSVVAKQWPIEACVVENGGYGFFGGRARLQTWDPLLRPERDAHSARLAALVQSVAQRFPDVALADDSGGRVSDVAWDVTEYASVPESRIESLMAHLQREGAFTTRSSVHVHATFVDCSKATGIALLAERVLGLSALEAKRSILFVGDSGNDVPAFAHFDLSVGVANVQKHALAMLPTYVTQGECGAGFRELAEHLCSIALPLHLES